MATATEPLIISQGECECCSVSAVHVHHRDFPDAQAEGPTAADASEQLIQQLTRSLEHTPTRERRETILHAIDEIRAYLSQNPPTTEIHHATAAETQAKGQQIMAIADTQPNEVIDVRPFGAAFADAKTTSLVKNDRLQILRMVIPRGKVIPTHTARGEITVHCLEGRVAFTTGSVTQELGPGRLLYVHGEQPHSVQALEDASLLVTIALPALNRSPSTPET